MPIYISPQGQQVPESEALNGRVVRDGYRVQIAHGEYVGFDHMLMDRAGSNTVFLTDAGHDAQVRAIVDRREGEHVAKFHFLGHQAPAFDRAAATLVARSQVADGNRTARDAAFASQYGPNPIGREGSTPDGSFAADARQMRDAARLAQY